MRTLETLRNGCLDGNSEQIQYFMDQPNSDSQEIYFTTDNVTKTGYYLLKFEAYLVINNGYATSDKLVISTMNMQDMLWNSSQYSNNFYTHANVFPLSALQIIECHIIYFDENVEPNNFKFLCKTTADSFDVSASNIQVTLRKIF